MKSQLYKDRRKLIGSLLQHERKFLKLEQNVIAHKMGVRQEDISKIESGTRRVDILELIEYAEALGFSITEIAWKIETYLTTLRLLPLQKRQVLNQNIGNARFIWNNILSRYNDLYEFFSCHGCPLNPNIRNLKSYMEKK